MKKITKTHQPASLRDWCKDNKDIDHNYRALLGSQAHKDLKQQLLSEQGALCAYTGRRIDDSNSHVEHLKPQNCCNDWEDVDYKNVVACFPADGGDTSHGYGAPVKAGWWNEIEFVSPLSENCERRFKFAWSGRISAEPENHASALKTIEVLKLDSPNLVKLRKARIMSFFGFSSNPRNKVKALSIKQAQIALDKIEEKDPYGQYMEYSFVLKQLLPGFIASGGANK